MGEGRERVIIEGNNVRDKWTESKANGSKFFEVKRILGVKARGKPITGNSAPYHLKENVAYFWLFTFTAV